MRIVRTQARLTSKYLKEAEKIVLEAIRTNNFKDLKYKLERVLHILPQNALKIVEEVARYEAEYSTKKLRKYSEADVVELDPDTAAENSGDVLISTTIGKPPLSIEETYQVYADTKVSQFMQIIDDGETQDLEDDEIASNVKDKTDGLFSYQLAALAGLAVIGTANMTRNEVAAQNDLQVDWVLDLELNNCPYCEDMADGGPYDPSEVDGLIPAHANCGCTLVPVLE